VTTGRHLAEAERAHVARVDQLVDAGVDVAHGEGLDGGAALAQLERRARGGPHATVAPLASLGGGEPQRIEHGGDGRWRARDTGHGGAGHGGARCRGRAASSRPQRHRQDVAWGGLARLDDADKARAVAGGGDLHERVAVGLAGPCGRAVQRQRQRARLQRAASVADEALHPRAAVQPGGDAGAVVDDDGPAYQQARRCAAA